MIKLSKDGVWKQQCPNCNLLIDGVDNKEERETVFTCKTCNWTKVRRYATYKELHSR